MSRNNSFTVEPVWANVCQGYSEKEDRPALKLEMAHQRSVCKINGEQFYLWRAVNHEGTVLECVVTKRLYRKAALKILRKLISTHGHCHQIVTDKLGSYRVALRDLGFSHLHETGQYKNNQSENSHLHFRRRERAMCRFRSMGSLQKFTSTQSQFHNHFQHQRHLEKRTNFKKFRNQPAADWQNICAA